MPTTTKPQPADSRAGDAGKQNGGTALHLPPTHDLLEIVQLADAASDWIKAQTAQAQGLVILEDPKNVLTLQLAAALRREARIKGIAVAVNGPNNDPVDGVAWDSDEELAV